MAAIAYAVTQLTAPVTTTSTTYGDVTGASIASSNFTAAKKYLLFITCQLKNNTSGDEAAVKVMHGTTDFAGTQASPDMFTVLNSISANVAMTAGLFQVWTAVSGEGIKLQFRAGTGGTATIDQIVMFMMNLSDDLTENTDWFYNVGTSGGLTTTMTTYASVTFTPAGASDWLVLAGTITDPGATTTSSIVRLERSGEASDLTPEARLEVADATNAFPNYLLSRVYTLGAASNTFALRAATSSGTAHSRLTPRVFALNLEKFRNHAAAYTAADVVLTGASPAFNTLLQSISLTPAVSGDVWISGYYGFDKQAVIRTTHMRLQVDNTDDPATQTSDIYAHSPGNDATDEEPTVISTVSTLSAAAHTMDLDAGCNNTTSSPAAQHRSLFAVTMELVSTGQTIVVGQVTESDVAQAITRIKAQAVAQVTETDVAQATTRLKARAVGQVAESDIAQVVAWAPKHRLVGQVSESDLAQAVGRLKVVAVAQALETDLAQAIGRLKAAAVAQVLESDLAQAIARLKTQAVGQVTELDLAQAVTVPGELVILVGQVSELDLAQDVTWAPKHRLVEQAAEVDFAQAIVLEAVQVVRKEWRRRQMWYRTGS